MEGFKRLNEFVEGRTGQFLTVRATKAWLDRERELENTLYAELKEESEILTNSKERKKHFKAAEPGWFEERLKEWKNPENGIVRIATPEHPLEVITGDVCLILGIENKEYILGFLRDIDPRGWLIPGGCPRSFEELLNPKITAVREIQEEVIIGDNKGIFFSFSPSKKELRENLLTWNLRPREVKMLNHKELSLKKGDAQNLVIGMEDRIKRTKNISITIDPQIASVCITLYWKINLPVKLSDVRIFDGEKGKKGPINRAVGLFTKENIKNKESPDVVFISGQNIFSANWNTQKMKETATIS